MMPSSVLDSKISFSCLYPNKCFGCTCFIQDLSSGLDKFSPRSIKCVFVGYSRTQKGYQCYNSSTRKYFVFADVKFFESIPYFSPQNPVCLRNYFSSTVVSLPAPASAASSPVSLVDISEPSASKSVWDFRYVYTHRQKVSASEPAPADPLQQTVLLHLPLTLISPLHFAKINDLTQIILVQSSFFVINLTHFLSVYSIRVFSVYTQVL